MLYYNFYNHLGFDRRHKKEKAFKYFYLGKQIFFIAISRVWYEVIDLIKKLSVKTGWQKSNPINQNFFHLKWQPVSNELSGLLSDFKYAWKQRSLSNFYQVNILKLTQEVKWTVSIAAGGVNINEY